MCFEIELNSHLSYENYCKAVTTSWLHDNEQIEQNQLHEIANHGVLCEKIKMIKKTSSNQQCGRDNEYKMVRF